MIIIGGGLTGLICANLMKGSIIIDPNLKGDGHKAILRFKTDRLSRALGMPFKKVKVIKGIWSNGQYVKPNPLLNNLYSEKVSGNIGNRSIMDISTEIRYIPPDNFYGLLIDGIDERLNRKVIEITRDEIKTKIPNTDKADTSVRTGVPIISTIPINSLAHITSMKMPTKFEYNPIWTRTVKVPNCNAYCTVYYPHPNTPIYRASLNGNKLIIESVSFDIEPDDCNFVFESLGIDNSIAHRSWDWNAQQFGKIFEIDSMERKNFIFQQTIQNNVYSLGRYATWRPKLMLDDLPQDISIIKTIIQDNYSANKHQQEEI